MSGSQAAHGDTGRRTSDLPEEYTVEYHDTDDTDDAKKNSDGSVLSWLMCCPAWRTRQPADSGSAAVDSTIGGARWIPWRGMLWKGAGSKRDFDPGRGYERVPLAHSDSETTISDATESGAPVTVRPAVVGRANAARRVLAATAARSPDAPAAAASVPPPSDFAALQEKLRCLSLLSAVSIAVDMCANGTIEVRLYGPLRTNYDIDEDSSVMTVLSAKGRLPPALFDVRGCPITPIVAMDAAEDLIAEFFSGTAAPLAGAVSRVVLSSLTLSSKATGNQSEQRQFSDDFASTGEGLSQKDAALIRSHLVKDAPMHDRMVAAADAFRHDYTVADVRQRARHFVFNVLEAVASPRMQELVFQNVVFGDTTLLGDLLGSPWMPRGARKARDATWIGGLSRLELRGCGLTPAQVHALVRELNAIQRGLHPYLEGNLFSTVETLVLFQSGLDSRSLQLLLGFISDTVVGDIDGTAGGLKHVVVDEESVQVVLKHRIAPFLSTINGRPVQDEFAAAC